MNSWQVYVYLHVSQSIRIILLNQFSCLVDARCVFLEALSWPLPYVYRRCLENLECFLTTPPTPPPRRYIHWCFSPSAHRRLQFCSRFRHGAVCCTASAVGFWSFRSTVYTWNYEFKQISSPRISMLKFYEYVMRSLLFKYMDHRVEYFSLSLEKFYWSNEFWYVPVTEISGWCVLAMLKVIKLINPLELYNNKPLLFCTDCICRQRVSAVEDVLNVNKLELFISFSWSFVWKVFGHL